MSRIDLSTRRLSHRGWVLARRPQRKITKQPAAEQFERRTRQTVAAWPPPRVRLNNLPAQLSSFIGREREIAETKHLLASTRLLTLVGSGGCGKTRLALRLAADLVESYADGVWLADLSSLSDPAFVPKAVASALDIPEQQLRPMTETLTNYLRTKTVLLLLDNCEHLRAACHSLTETLLRAGAAVRILATSREALGVEGEVTYRVPSLRLPDVRQAASVEHLAEYDAIRLFVDRAALAQPGFALTERTAGPVTQICWRLDGLPLAIELAAARVRMLPLEQIAARLDDRFRLLTGGSRTALPRRETLRATMDWSYSLLSESERLMWRRLAIFTGGFTLDAAEAVCAGGGVETADILDLLTSLADKSLVIADVHGEEARYRLLETVQKYGWEKLAESREIATMRTRHLDWYLEFAERAEPGLWGSQQRVWLERLEAEHDNLRAVLHWIKTERRSPEIALRIAGALWPFWLLRGYWSEGRSWLEAGQSNDGSVPFSIQAKALIGAGLLALPCGDYKTAASLGEQSLSLCRTLGDKRGIVLSLHNLANAARYVGDYGRLAAWGEESRRLSQELGDTLCLALSLVVLAWDARRLCNFREAMALYGESVRLFKELGDAWHTGSVLIELGHVALARRDYTAATAAYDECLPLFRGLGQKLGIASTLTALGRVAVRQGQYARAEALCRESLTLAKELEDKYTISRAESVLGDALRGQGAGAKAVQLYKDSLALHHYYGAKVEIPVVLESLAATRSGQDQPRDAVCLYAAAAALRDEIGAPMPPSARVDHDHDIAGIRGALGGQTFAAAWAEGRAMTLDQAIEYALALPNEPATGRPRRTPDRAANGAALLAPREREVAALVAEGLSNREIAERLLISERTAETHVQHILNKLGCNSRARIATWAARHGLVPDFSQ